MKYVSYLNFTFWYKNLLCISLNKHNQELVNIGSYATYDMESIMKIKHSNLISPLLVLFVLHEEDHLAFLDIGFHVCTVPVDLEYH